MSDNVIAFAKSFARWKCSCEYNMGSCSIGTFDPLTGKSTPGHYDRGPRTFHCNSCKAREALEADGIEYEKDKQQVYDGLQYMVDHGIKVPIDTACKTFEGQTFVTSGSLTLEPGPGPWRHIQ